MDWNNLWSISLIALPLSLFLVSALRSSGHTQLLIFTFLVCSISPIVPVLGMFSSRYVFVFALLVFAAMGEGISLLSQMTERTSLKYIPSLLLGTCLILAGCISVEKSVTKWKRYSDEIQREGTFLLHHEDSNAVLITNHGHCYWAFSPLRKWVMNLPQGPSFCKNDCVCPFLHPDKEVWFQIDGNLFRAKHFAKKSSPEECGQAGDLDILIRYANGMLSWQFGPHKEGRYLIYVRGWDTGMLQVKRTAELPYAINLKEDFILVKYESPRGWSVYSPVLTFQTNEYGEGIISWRRSAPKNLHD